MDKDPCDLENTRLTMEDIDYQTDLTNIYDSSIDLLTKEIVEIDLDEIITSEYDGNDGESILGIGDLVSTLYLIDVAEDITDISTTVSMNANTITDSKLGDNEPSTIVTGTASAEYETPDALLKLLFRAGDVEAANGDTSQISKTNGSNLLLSKTETLDASVGDGPVLNNINNNPSKIGSTDNLFNNITHTDDVSIKTGTTFNAQLKSCDLQQKECNLIDTNSLDDTGDASNTVIERQVPNILQNIDSGDTNMDTELDDLKFYYSQLNKMFVFDKKKVKNELGTGFKRPIHEHWELKTKKPGFYNGILSNRKACRKAYEIYFNENDG